MSSEAELRDALIDIRDAAIKHGVNDEVAAAIAHAEVVARMRPSPHDETPTEYGGFFHRLVRSAAFPILVVVVLAFFAQKLISG